MSQISIWCFSSEGIDGGMKGWMEGEMDGWKDGWMDGWMDGWIKERGGYPRKGKRTRMLPQTGRHAWPQVQEQETRLGTRTWRQVNVVEMGLNGIWPGAGPTEPCGELGLHSRGEG